uniref:Dilute domain-containing protein n=1 Tax=Heterorhabditis bacteriophora TaxID=37862 RepID=A0A1I7X657_HETBA
MSDAKGKHPRMEAPHSMLTSSLFIVRKLSQAFFNAQHGDKVARNFINQWLTSVILNALQYISAAHSIINKKPSNSTAVDHIENIKERMENRQFEEVQSCNLLTVFIYCSHLIRKPLLDRYIAYITLPTDAIGTGYFLLR